MTALDCHHHRDHQRVDTQARGPGGVPNCQVIALREIRHIQLFRNYGHVMSFLFNFAQASYGTELFNFHAVNMPILVQ